MVRMAYAPSPIGSEHRAGSRRRARNHDYQQTHVRAQIAETVARFLIGYRQRHELTQRQLADRLGMQESGIRRLERGDHTPNARTLQRIVEELNARLALTGPPSTP